MKPSDQCIKNFLRKGQSFALTGPIGCGKTYFMKSMFKQTNTKFITINCTLADKKASFIKLLNHQISRFLKLQKEHSFKTSISMDSWIREFNDLLQQSDHYKNCLNNTYIFMDCIQELKMNQIFLMTFYKICQQELNIKFNFVFCGIYFGVKRYQDHQPFRKMIKFCMPKPQQHTVQNVIRQIIEKTFEKYKIKQKFQKNDKNIQAIQQSYQSGVKYLTNYLTTAFQGIQTDLNKIKRMSNIIVTQYQEEFMKPLKQAQKKQNQVNVNKVHLMKSSMLQLFLHTNKGKHGVQTVIQNQELPDDQIRTLMRQEKINVNLNNENNQEIRLKKLQEKIEIYKRNFYPDLILASIYYADLYVQSCDSRRFLDHRTVKGKKALPFSKFNMIGPKHNLQRIVAISQAIQGAQQNPNTPETMYFHHTLDYYSCFPHLLQNNMIKYYGKQATWGKRKIFGRPNIIEVENFMKTFSINQSQYTGE